MNPLFRIASVRLAAWPIDLMFVDSDTFSAIYSEAVEFELGVCKVKVVSIRHLAALKIHALKVYQEHRHLKDYSDLIGLLRHSTCNLAPDELKELCLKYADERLFSKLKNDLSLREE